jgi:hypothetical protein
VKVHLNLNKRREWHGELLGIVPFLFSLLYLSFLSN